MSKQTEIGGLCNYYGCLEVKEEDGKFYWSIENYDGHYWKEIPESLYNALIEFEHNRLTETKVSKN